MQINIKDILEVASLHDSQRPRGHRCIVARQAAPEVSTLNQRVTFICYQSPERDGLITAVKSIIHYSSVSTVSTSIVFLTMSPERS